MSARIKITRRQLFFWGIAAAVFAAYAVLVARQRPLVWKLADQVFCLADWEGFRETALPGLYPGAALRWTSSLLMTTGLCDGWWQIPYFILPLMLVRKAGVAPFLLTAASLLHLGTRVWQLTDFAFPLTNLLGMCMVAGLFSVLRPLCRKQTWGMPVAAGICSAAFVPCGLYALFAGALLLADRMQAVRRELKEWGGCAAALAILSATPALASALVYDDLSLKLTIGFSQSVLDGALLDTFGFWPATAFLLLGWKLLGACAPARMIVSGLLCAAVFIGLPSSDVRAQLRMERLMLDRRYSEALADDDANDKPLRMSLAYRVLALWRTGRLENDLFRRPFTSFHRSSGAQELKMGGEWLLFEYGFLLPARQQTMELVAARGWQPRYLQLAGDAAFLIGEHALAVRDWRQLERCPFRGRQARQRLEALASGRGIDDSVFSGLRPVSEIHRVWNETLRKRSEPPFFYFRDFNAENFVYGRCLETVHSPTPDVARLILAVYLLEKDVKAFARSRSIMDVLCPQGPWPRLWQQGMLACLGACDAEERSRVVDSLRAGVFSDEEVTRYDAFTEDLKKAQKEPVDFLARYGDTYYYYDVFVK